MFKNILVAIDLSPRSKLALHKAIKFAHIFNSKLILLNVHEEFLNKDVNKSKLPVLVVPTIK